MSEKKKGVLGVQKIEVKEKDNKNHRDPMFVGIDPSYNGFGLIILDKDGNIVKEILHKAKGTEIEERLIDLEELTKFVPQIMGLQKIYIEGPSYASAGQSVLQMGALHFMLRVNFFKNKAKYKIVAPGTIKKFVTGDGRAKKDLMLLKVYKKWGVEFADDNLADAYSLARMALEDYTNGKDK